jgi:hypothetical protein
MSRSIKIDAETYETLMRLKPIEQRTIQALVARAVAEYAKSTGHKKAKP